MASDLLACIQLDKQSMASQVLVAKEISGCDSSFITSCILGHAIKNKSPVLLVLIHNSLSHYQNVGVRMYYNIKNSINSGQVDVFDFAEEVESVLLRSKHNTLDNIFSKISDKIIQMQDKHHQVSVIVDGVSHLFDLQYSIKEINQFCRQIVKAVRHRNGFVLFHCNVAIEDDTTQVLSNLLSHMAHTILQVESLPSGRSADVSGHLKVTYPSRKFDEKILFNMNLEPSQFLFKLFDKGVKLFAPGTV